jgi:hypothetical protein
VKDKDLVIVKGVKGGSLSSLSATLGDKRGARGAYIGL